MGECWIWGKGELLGEGGGRGGGGKCGGCGWELGGGANAVDVSLNFVMFAWWDVDGECGGVNHQSMAFLDA